MDVSVLAHGSVLGIGVVTDDVDVRILGKEFGVEVITTLALLEQMLDAGHITIGKIRQIAAYWMYEGDLPADFRHEYRQRFSEPPP